jgi:RNA polymerase sigma factor (sigma-70 family)
VVEETQIGGSQYRFRETYWTAILKAKDKASPGYDEALNYLIATYWKPVYFYIRRKGYDIEAAKDLTQSFFTVFLEKDFLRLVEKGKGRFRTFILTALDRFLSKERERLHAQKRGGSRVILALDFKRAETEFHLEPGTDETPEKILIRTWASITLEQAMCQLRQEFAAPSRRVYLTVFESCLTTKAGDQLDTYKDLSRRLGISATDVKNYLHRVRQRYRELIKDEIRKYVTDEDELKSEIAELFSAFQ